MKKKPMNCCQTPKQNSSFKKGLLYGILPHTFCIAFMVFSIFGAVGVTSFFRRWLLTPYFFQLLVAFSFVLAIVSMVLYLHQNNCLSFAGMRKKAHYLSILSILIVGVNAFFFLVAFPLFTNLNSKNIIKTSDTSSFSRLTLKVAIPCSGHAPLVVEELRKISGIAAVKFELPNRFNIEYSNKTSADKILKTEIFKSFKAVRI